MFREKRAEPQRSLWIATGDLPRTPVNSFYERVDRALVKVGFGDAVRALCAPYYEQDAQVGGRPGIDPEVYVKMQLIGFFENLASERAIAARCADSFSIRAFLHYTLTERTPDHSTLTVIRQRLPATVFEEIFGLVLAALKKNKLLRGKRLAIDASVLEANASLRSLEHRLTGEAYAAYVQKLAEAAGVDGQDRAAVARFDRKRPGRKTSNKEWHNPHDPDARIGPTKRGNTRMIYKPEHVVDLDTGAIVAVDVRPGDEHDTADLKQRVLAAEEQMNTALGDSPGLPRVESVAADKGYYKVEELTRLQELGIRTVISDPLDNRRLDRLAEKPRAAVRAARRTVRSRSGKALLARRGELLERSFQHVLDAGGARRTTLRGRENIRKRYLLQAMAANLSLLLRTLTGIGTPKQALAAAEQLQRLITCLQRFTQRLRRIKIAPASIERCFERFLHFPDQSRDIAGYAVHAPLRLS
ncbi:MAG: transposase [Longimicrobiales bacterium]